MVSAPFFGTSRHHPTLIQLYYSLSYSLKSLNQSTNTLQFSLPNPVMFHKHCMCLGFVFVIQCFDMNAMNVLYKSLLSVEKINLVLEHLYICCSVSLLIYFFDQVVLWKWKKGWKHLNFTSLFFSEFPTILMMLNRIKYVNYFIREFRSMVS